MLAIVFVGFIAASAAAPHYPYGPTPYHHYDPFGQELFDTRQFWTEMANEMREIDTMLANFHKMFPSIVSTQGVVNGQYKITIPLRGFEEKDIVVKAREGLLMVQAIHKTVDGSENSYLDVKTLPTFVNVTGSWSFENGVLKIVFPLKTEVVNEEGVTEEAVTDEVPTEETVTEWHSREKLGSSESDADSKGNFDDADVGVTFNQQQNRELITNEIPSNSVEATTYAVDLKGDVEFVPVRFG